MCSLMIKTISLMQISTLRWYSHHTVCRCELTPGHANKCIFYFVFIHNIQKSWTSIRVLLNKAVYKNKIKKGIENLYTLHEFITEGLHHTLWIISIPFNQVRILQTGREQISHLLHTVIVSHVTESVSFKIKVHMQSSYRWVWEKIGSWCILRKQPFKII